jgi:hypothetical protein
LGALGSRYFVYVLSFAVIGTLWLAHHRTFRYVRRADEALMSLNVLFLMAVAGGLLGALLLLARRRRLLTPEATHESIVAGLWGSASTVGVFTLCLSPSPWSHRPWPPTRGWWSFRSDS